MIFSCWNTTPQDKHIVVDIDEQKFEEQKKSTYRKATIGLIVFLILGTTCALLLKYGLLQKELAIVSHAFTDKIFPWLQAHILQPTIAFLKDPSNGCLLTSVAICGGLLGSAIGYIYHIDRKYRENQEILQHPIESLSNDTKKKKSST